MICFFSKDRERGYILRDGIVCTAQVEFELTSTWTMMTWRCNQPLLLWTLAIANTAKRCPFRSQEKKTGGPFRLPGQKGNTNVLG